MPPKAVFISSTYKDLRDYRRQVWDALKQFDVTVRGMEQFGARTAAPLDTCLAEVEQCDVYVGIIAYRLGSIDPETRKPFTVLEYEKAVEQKKEILVYIADDEAASFPQSVVDEDTRTRKRLMAFKRTLRERHTVDTFSTPDDLVDKLSRDFKKHFLLRQEEPQSQGVEEVFAKSASALREFLLTPKRYNGHEVRLCVRFRDGVFPASRNLCQHFNLEYGFTVGAYVQIEKPQKADNSTFGFREIYATGNKVDALYTLVQAKRADLYAQLQFAEEDVKGVEAEFLGRTYYDIEYDMSDPNEVYVPPEAKVILLFTKPA
jgi:Domain of unknown function (DUF4062)